MGQSVFKPSTPKTVRLGRRALKDKPNNRNFVLLPHSSSGQLDMQRQTKVEQLVLCGHEAYRTAMDLMDSLASQHTSAQIREIRTMGDWEVVYGQYVPCMVQCLSCFAKALPQFLDVSPEDQRLLIKGSIMETAIILDSVHVTFDTHTLLNTKFRFRLDLRQAQDLGVLGKLYCQIQLILFKLRRLQLTDVEVSLLCALVLFCPDREGVKTRRLLENLETDLALALRCQLFLNHGDGFLTFARIVEVLVDLRALSTQFLDYICNARLHATSDKVIATSDVTSSSHITATSDVTSPSHVTASDVITSSHHATASGSDDASPFHITANDVTMSSHVTASDVTAHVTLNDVVTSLHVTRNDVTSSYGASRVKEVKDSGQQQPVGPFLSGGVRADGVAARSAGHSRCTKDDQINGDGQNQKIDFDGALMTRSNNSTALNRPSTTDVTSKTASNSIVPTQTVKSETTTNSINATQTVRNRRVLESKVPDSDRKTHDLTGSMEGVSTTTVNSVRSQENSSSAGVSASPPRGVSASSQSSPSPGISTMTTSVSLNGHRGSVSPSSAMSRKQSPLLGEHVQWPRPISRSEEYPKGTNNFCGEMNYRHKSSMSCISPFSSQATSSVEMNYRHSPSVSYSPPSPFSTLSSSSISLPHIQRALEDISSQQPPPELLSSSLQVSSPSMSRCLPPPSVTVRHYHPSSVAENYLGRSLAPRHQLKYSGTSTIETGNSTIMKNNSRCSMTLKQSLEPLAMSRNQVRTSVVLHQPGGRAALRSELETGVGPAHSLAGYVTSVSTLTNSGHELAGSVTSTQGHHRLQGTSPWHLLMRQTVKSPGNYQWVPSTASMLSSTTRTEAVAEARQRMKWPAVTSRPFRTPYPTSWMGPQACSIPYRRSSAGGSPYPVTMFPGLSPPTTPAPLSTPPPLITADGHMMVEEEGTVCGRAVPVPDRGVRVPPQCGAKDRAWGFFGAGVVQGTPPPPLMTPDGQVLITGSGGLY
ncbi:hypothetical protein ACOMHN_004384 [Nucella lapillus]